MLRAFSNILRTKRLSRPRKARFRSPKAKLSVRLSLENLEDRLVPIGGPRWPLSSVPSLEDLTSAIGIVRTSAGSCTGSLLQPLSAAASPEWVLTAAHCVEDVHPGQTVTFQVGGAGEIIPGTEVHVAPGYQHTSGILWGLFGENVDTDHDVALIHLSRQASGVHGLYLHRDATLNGQGFYPVGFGGTTDNPCDQDSHGFGQKYYGFNRVNGPNGSHYDVHREDGSFLVPGDSGGPDLVPVAIHTLEGPATSFEILGVHSNAEVVCPVGVRLRTRDHNPRVDAWVSWIDGYVQTPSLSGIRFLGPGGQTYSGLVGNSVDLTVTGSPRFSGLVASFSDNSGEPHSAGDYVARIIWGDGSSSVGSISERGLAFFNIASSHYYAHLGSYTVAVTISRAGQASIALNSTASVAWTLPDRAGVTSSVYDGSSTVYALGANGNLWRYNTAGWSRVAGNVVSLALGARGRVIFLGNDQKLYAFTEGQPVQDLNLPRAVESFAMTPSGRVIFLGNDQKLYAFTEGQPVQDLNLPRAVESFAMTPNGRVIFLGNDQKLWAFSEGQPVQDLNLPRAVESFAMTPNGRVFFLGVDQKLYAFSEAFPVQQENLPVAVQSFAVTPNGRVFLLGVDQKLYAFSETFPVQQENLPVAVQSFAVTPNGRVFFLGVDQKLYAFSEAFPVQQENLPVAVQSFAVTPNGRVFFLGVDQKLYAFSEAFSVQQENLPVAVQSFAATPNGRVSFLGTDSKIYAFSEGQPIVYQAGALNPIADKRISAGQTLIFTATLADSNVTARNVTFSLDSGAPAGASINPDTGVFTWAPAADQTWPRYAVTIRARHSIAPGLSDAKSFMVIVDEGSGAGQSAWNKAALALTHSAEYYSNIVTAAYHRYLGRNPDTAGLANWVTAFQNGLSDEQLEAVFIGSPEYIQNHGGTGEAWVVGLYRDLLGRDPDAQGLQAWLNALKGGMAPGQIALGFAASGEREGQRITADYQKYLGRDPEPNIVPRWVDAFLHGTSNEDVVAGFVGAPEYFQRHGSNIREWLFSAYQDTLGRAPDPAGYNSWLEFLRKEQ